jgi:hypothetical protein
VPERRGLSLGLANFFFDFAVVILRDNKQLGAWMFAGPDDPIAVEIREDLAIVLGVEPNE